MNDRRKVKDRRVYNLKQDEKYECSRRIKPCRRLGSISAEWVPMGTINRNPVIRDVFRKLGCTL